MRDKTPELREAISNILLEVARLQEEEGKYYCGVPRIYEAKVIALIQPEIDKAVKAERERIEKEVRAAQLVPEYSWVYQIIKGSPS